jgi:hypothetical protein
VTANAQSRAYGGANPTLTYVATGLINGDTLTGALATTVGALSNVGAYGITQGTLAASSNYALTYTENDLTVTRAALSIVADPENRAYGDANPTLTYVETGLVNSDTLTGTPRDDRDRHVQRRWITLCHHPRDPGGLLELCAELCRQYPHRDGCANSAEPRCDFGICGFSSRMLPAILKAEGVPQAFHQPSSTTNLLAPSKALGL